jgi:tRNA (guanosine-2'-O-)-methyltransferase
MPTDRRAARVFEVLARRQPDLTVLAEDVYKPHNLSAMLRSCDAVGIGTVHAVRPTGGVPTYQATSASAEKWVDLVVHQEVEAAIDALRAEGRQVLAAHLSADARDYRDVEYVRPTAILFGNERSGVSERAAARADAHIVIPMLGMVRSLNVSVAAAVILFEAQRQRRLAGRYAEPALSARERNDLAFRWLYPHEAARRDQKGEPAPWLDEDGDLWRGSDEAPPWARRTPTVPEAPATAGLDEEPQP